MGSRQVTREVSLTTGVIDTRPSTDMVGAVPEEKKARRALRRAASEPIETFGKRTRSCVASACENPTARQEEWT
jgi:hypothetical protein